MPDAEERTVSLPREHAEFVDRMVASGAYASDGEVIRAGLRALQERDADVERRLREDVAPVHDAMRADPGRALGLDDVFACLRGHHAGRTSGRG